MFLFVLIFALIFNLILYAGAHPADPSEVSPSFLGEGGIWGGTVGELGMLWGSGGPWGPLHNIALSPAQCGNPPEPVHYKLSTFIKHSTFVV